MPKRGNRVAPPPGPGEWDLRYGDSGAVEGWEQLCSQAPGPALTAWTALRTDPRARSQRQHPLKGDFSDGQTTRPPRTTRCRTTGSARGPRAKATAVLRIDNIKA